MNGLRTTLTSRKGEYIFLEAMQWFTSSVPLSNSIGTNKTDKRPIKSD